jgi:peptidoglycan/LPS O-acetylase OafA/YrhL
MFAVLLTSMDDAVQGTATPPAQGGTMRRIPELDALRGIAILLVLVHHTEFAVLYAPELTRLMWLGVDLFFVLSGFLITEILLRKPKDRGFILNFYARRALRIWPPYYLLVLFVWLFGTPLFGSSLQGRALVHYLTFTQNVSFAPMELAFHPALQSTWSLAVEEQFYLLWPPLTLGFRRRALAVTLTGIILLAVVVRAEGG